MTLSSGPHTFCHQEMVEGMVEEGGWGRGGGDSFRMIQVRYISCGLFSNVITLAPSQIIGHWILEAGDP